ALTVLLAFLGDLIGGSGGALIALVFAGVLNFGAYWWSDKLVLKMYGARRVSEKDSPELYGILRDLSMRARLPMPAVYIIDQDTPNAFATGRNPEHAAVAATSGILKLLNREELEGVLAHELSHIRHRDILISTIAATIAGAITYLSRMAYFASLFGGGRHDRQGANPLSLLIMVIVAPLAALVIQLAVSRSREYGADQGGATLADPMSLASALRKLEYFNRRMPMRQAGQATAHLFIVNPLSGAAFAKLFSTHPPIEDRVSRLEGMAGAGRKAA
ncbi:MAG: zinc metalloprotease HtpX, partial [Deltaproteobacteria bacterium]|nr:zinc metalloprotease HtpX [Deltaproteobacteria bacterium]